ncbi:hypothetical protein ACFXKC_50930 [Streptomyces sp. NPDC059340]|uniref:hypothetical protein n=1 Tax=Streptomyces sp. NPDC059340 TaxID=3346806 RepID=UPI00367F4A9A
MYAGVRDPESVREPGVETLRLDVTDEDQIAAAAVAASDATIVINNAGIQAVRACWRDLWRARGVSWR